MCRIPEGEALFDSIQADINDIEEEVEPEFCTCDARTDTLVCGQTDLTETTLGMEQQAVDIMRISGMILTTCTVLFSLPCHFS